MCKIHSRIVVFPHKINSFKFIGNTTWNNEYYIIYKSNVEFQYILELT